MLTNFEVEHEEGIGRVRPLWVVHAYRNHPFGKEPVAACWNEATAKMVAAALSEVEP